MHAVVRRPHFAAGVALIGASVIAASAVTPMPEIHLPEVSLPTVHVADLHLAALANPLEVYQQVFGTAFANLYTLGANTIPGQLLHQLLQNQLTSATALLQAASGAGGGIAQAVGQIPATITTAIGLLAQGDVSGAVNAILSVPLSVAAPALNLLPVIGQALTQPLQNLANVIHAFTADSLTTLLAVSGFIAPFISVPGAAAVAVQNVLQSFGTGDPAQILNAIVAAPATVIDGLLNGGYGPDLGPLVTPGIVVKAGGLLSSAGLIFNEDGSFFVNTGGPLYSLQQVLSIITKAITPAAPAPAAAIASIPAATAATVTLAPTTTPATTPAKPAATVPDKTATTPDKTTPDETTPDKTTTPDETATSPADTTGATDTKDSSTATAPVTTKDGGETTSGATTSPTKGSDTKDSDTKGSDTKGSDTKGSDTKSSDTKSSDTKSSDTKSSDTKNSDTKSSDKGSTKQSHESSAGAKSKAA